MIPYGLQTRTSGPTDVAGDTLCVCPMAFGLWVCRHCNNNNNNSNPQPSSCSHELISSSQGAGNTVLLTFMTPILLFSLLGPLPCASISNWIKRNAKEPKHSRLEYTIAAKMNSKQIAAVLLCALFVTSSAPPSYAVACVTRV